MVWMLILGCVRREPPCDDRGAGIDELTVSVWWETTMMLQLDLRTWGLHAAEPYHLLSGEGGVTTGPTFDVTLTDPADGTVFGTSTSRGWYEEGGDVELVVAVGANDALDAGRGADELVLDVFARDRCGVTAAAAFPIVLDERAPSDSGG